MQSFFCSLIHSSFPSFIPSSLHPVLFSCIHSFLHPTHFSISFCVTILAYPEASCTRPLQPIARLLLKSGRVCDRKDGAYYQRLNGEGATNTLEGRWLWKHCPHSPHLYITLWYIPFLHVCFNLHLWAPLPPEQHTKAPFGNLEHEVRISKVPLEK